jgi:hypothetical protein
MSEKVQCPNCLEPAEKVGNKITCQACDSVLTITRTGGAKLAEIGWKEELENRIKANEDLLAGLLGGEPGAEADAKADAAEAEADAEVEEDDILPR